MKFDIHYFKVVASTMDLARSWQAGAPDEGAVIQAGQQEGGRGRRGNQWASPQGNLYQSIVLRPKIERQYWGQLSFVIAVALAKACVEVGIPKDDVQLKWPNDVLIKGQKLAGILIENQGDFVIVGTGVNIQHAPEDRSKIHDYARHSIDEFRDIFLACIGNCYHQWQNQGFAPIHRAWMEQAYKLGEQIQARLPNAIYEGVFENLTEHGILLLREKSGLLREIHSGEIICS